MKAHNSTLNRGTKELKRTPLNRGTSSLTRSPLKRGRKKTYKTKKERQEMVDELVADRGNKCERCGRPIPKPNRFNDHHVIPKRKPYCGPDDLWNRKLLCSSWWWDIGAMLSGNLAEIVEAPQGCHEYIEGHPDQARKEGYLCPKGYRYKEGE